ncbi:MAG: Asparagine synthetase [glutamine-hydrolyzing] 1 [bacterium]|nr:Asparagine synthetase [glutamine-hydrolyzing] 1 [bacterium]
MCGISGILNWQQQTPETLATIKAMVGALGHRGPDGRGVYIDDYAALGHARLSIIDPQGGRQPLSNEDGSIWLTCNGEIFNYLELRAELETAGHRFASHTDVEVLVHLYEDYGEALLDHLNGQFAFALWDRHRCKLLLARDHIGICPLYYLTNHRQFAFASEIKALLHIPGFVPELNLSALHQTFTFWSPLPGETPFQKISEIKPGCYLWAERERIHEHRYWSLPFPPPDEQQIHDTAAAVEELTSLLADAVKLRLRSDVPVGAYLSGGLDSSITTALIKTKNPNRLRTFSVGFAHTQYDETRYQQLVSSHLGTEHSCFTCANQHIGEILPEVIWHTEKPLLRTAPAPLFLLSKLVQDSGFKVVLTGEGADEFFAGYNIFKETKLRCFNARQPDSQFRPWLFKRLYPYLNFDNRRGGAFWQDFFQQHLLDTTDPFYSHRIRWQNSAFVLNFLHPEILSQLHVDEPVQELAAQLSDYAGWETQKPLVRAHFLESYIFLGSYLLSSQGDRMLMSHAIEGRYPFLDRRLIALASRLRPSLKLKGLQEKWILKQAFARLLPPEVTQRNKTPYRAPIKDAYLAGRQVLEEFLSATTIKQDSLFANEKVALLKKKFEHPNMAVSEREEMALVAIVTTGMLIKLFMNGARPPSRENKTPWWILDKRSKPTPARQELEYIAL